MDLLDIVLVIAAGVAAGAINTAIGSGSLVTYPALLLAGLPPVVANVTNTIGLTPGSLLGAWAFRRELKAQSRALLRLVPIAIIGGIAGASLLLVLPADVFRFVVPVLVIVAAILVGLQPVIRRRLPAKASVQWMPLSIAIAGASIYGGYFSAAQGILLLGIVGVWMGGAMTAQNAMKNLLQAVVNLISAIFFLISAPFHWGFVICVAIGALAGAPLGAWLSRKVPETLFRGIIVCFGLVVGVILAVQAFAG